MSPNMRELHVPERDQWIPWEISYSLRLKRAGDNRSNRNGILLVYLPDLFGQYHYNDGRYQAEFTIIRRNQDNIKPFKNDPLLRLPASYFISCTWDQFLSQMHFWIANADRQRHFAERYDITIQVDWSVVLMIQYRRSRVHCHVVPAIITVTTPQNGKRPCRYPWTISR